MGCTQFRDSLGRAVESVQQTKLSQIHEKALVESQSIDRSGDHQAHAQCG